MSDEQEKQELIKRMGSKDNAVALAAVDELRGRGWLEDGTVSDRQFPHANLRGANLSRADLSETNLIGADLSEANLSSAFFDRANLGGADLNNTHLDNSILEDADLNLADLSDASLKWVDLSNADLGDANLSGADLTDAVLIDAELRNANLSKATLAYTNLTGAYLLDADLTNAMCFLTIFGDNDLSTTKGLETIEHRGPSIVDIGTFYKSKGNIPEKFLRGCGVPEEFITYIPSLTGRAIEFYSCFISYSHDDKAFARRIHDTLQGQGIRCWLDEKQVNPGDDIYHEIDRGVRLWDKVLLCCSRSALSEKWWVDHEIDKAFQKERDLMKDRKEKVLSLIPLDLDGFLFSDDCTNPKAQQIRSRIAADFKGWEKDNDIFEREIQRVIKALRTDGGKEQPPESKL